jgi:hypothetical protein
LHRLLVYVQSLIFDQSLNAFLIELNAPSFGKVKKEGEVSPCKGKVISQQAVEALRVARG